MQQAFLIAATALVGSLSAIQAGTNSTLGRTIGQIQAGLATTVLSALSFVAIGLFLGGLSVPDGGKLAGAPAWAWVGGFVGAGILSSQLFVAKSLGSATFAGVFVTASLITSVTLDHFGFVGFEQHPAGWLRVGGLALMLAGVFMVSAG